MEKLIELSDNLVERTKTSFLRYLHSCINWDNRLIAIQGARGVGKTTMMLQHIKLNHKVGNEVVYASMNHLYFATHSLLDFADDFVKNGGQ